MDFDELLPEIGEYGTYQKLVLWFLLVPGVFPCGFHAYNQLFMASLPEHWCRVPALREAHPNASEELLKKISIPYDNATKSFSKCSRYDLDYENALPKDLSWSAIEDNETLSQLLAFQSNVDVVPCDNGWHYQLDQYTTTIIADWDLVCDKAFFPTLALVLLGVSGLIGNYIFGFMQDRLGRRPPFFIYLCVLCVFGLGTAFVPSFAWWLGCRIGVGFTVPAIMTAPMILALELVGPAQRTYTTVIMNVAYSFTLITLAAVAYFVRIWSQLTLATTIPFLAFFGFWWVLPESPRWLLAKGRVDEAYKIISTMARVNKKPLRSDLLSSLKKHQDKEETKSAAAMKKAQKKYGLFDLFRTPNLCKKTLIITFIWFTNTSVYVGLSYYAPVLGGDPYLNFFLAGLSELPTYLFLWPSMEYWGRRWTLCSSMVVGGSACIATVLTQNDHLVTLVLYCIGKFGISSSFVVLPLMASELYPTVVRGMGLGVSSTAGMIGPVIIPLINYLGSEMLVLPLMIMGALLVLGGISSLVLPETLHQHLPQSLEEGENFGKKMTTRDYCNCCPRRRMKKVEISQESPATNDIPLETDELRPLPDDDFFEESSYSSLRRNSFLKAQSKAVPFDEKTKLSYKTEGDNEKIPGNTKSSTKSTPKSSFGGVSTTGSLDRNLLRNGHDSPLIESPTKITII